MKIKKKKICEILDIFDIHKWKVFEKEGEFFSWKKCSRCGKEEALFESDDIDYES